MDTVDKLLGYMSAHPTAADQVRHRPL
jgi:hypothetical protein